ETQIGQLLRGLGNNVPTIQRVMIYVHPDKFFREPGLHVAGELECVIQRLLIMIERILDAFANEAATLALQVAGKRAQERVSAEWKRQAVRLLPPSAQIADAMEP